MQGVTVLLPKLVVCALFSALHVVADLNLKADDIPRPYSSYALRNHKSEVCAVKFAPDGRHLASVDDDGTLVVWDVKKRCVAHRILLPIEIGSDAGIEWNARSSRLICFSPGSGVAVADLKAKKKARVVFSKSRFIEVDGFRYLTTSAIQLTADGRSILRGANGTIRQLGKRPEQSALFLKVIDLMTRKTRLLKAERPIVKVELLNNSSFVSLDATGAIVTGHISKADATRAARKGMQLPAMFGALALTSDGRLIAVAGKPGQIEVWVRSPLKIAQTLKLSGRKHGDVKRVVSAIAFASNGSAIAAGTAGGYVQVLMLKKQGKKGELSVSGIIHDLQFAPSNSNLLAILNGDNVLTIFDVRRNKTTTVKSVTSFDWSSDGRCLAVAGMENGKVMIFDVK